MKITLELNDLSAKYFANVKYSLDKGNGEETTDADVINHCLQELSLFEDFTEDQLTNWLTDNYPDKYKAFLETLKQP